MRWAFAALLLGLTGPAGAAGGWIADARGGCQVWNPNPRPGETVTWMGLCHGGRAEGQGVALWFRGSTLLERDEGQWQAGRQVNAGVQQWPGGRYEGALQDSLPHGRGVLMLDSGERYAGSFREGKPDGAGRLETRAGPYDGVWRAGCFREGDRQARFGTAEACP